MAADDTSVRDIGSRRELFVDAYLVSSLRGASVQMQRPRPGGAALLLGAPWEGAFCCYTTVLLDEGLYRMYYRGAPDPKATEQAAVTCYATSGDGIEWSKPELGLHEVCGSRRNNVIIAGDPAAPHNFSLFIDRRPGVPEGERFKAVGGIQRDGPYAYVSADGVRWRRMREEPLLTYPAFAFDSQNVAFWSESEGCYVLYFRTWHPRPGAPSKYGVRWVSRATSEDFLRWSAPVEMDAGDTPCEELYTQQTHPYFRAPHIYVALAARFQPGRRALTDEQVRALNVYAGYGNDCSDAVLLTSRGGNHYDRTFLESFIRPGLGPGHWVSRANYPALGVVPTGPAEMSLYVNRRYAQPGGYIERMTLRLDGFAALHAPYVGGEMVTKPLRFAGGALELNVSTSAAGAVRVEVQDGSGRPIPGFSLDEADEIFGDEIERLVSWKGSTDVSPLAGRPVRLRFVMKDADLFALRFR